MGDRASVRCGGLPQQPSVEVSEGPATPPEKGTVMSVYGHEYILNTEVEYRLERAGVGRGNPGLGGSGAWAGIRSGF